MELTGSERFSGVDAGVIDFWRYAMPSFLTNNVRGYLAEFLVAQAVGAQGPRVEWDAFDVLAPDGTRIEVKSSGYLQAWESSGPSKIVFAGLRSKLWSPQLGYASESTYNADVYVFCVQTAQHATEYDQLDVTQWRFHVLSSQVLASTGLKSISLATVRRLAGDAVSYDELAFAIQRCTAAPGGSIDPAVEASGSSSVPDIGLSPGAGY